QQRTLEFGQTAIVAVSYEGVLAPPLILETHADLEKLGIIRDDCAPLARIEVFRSLEAEAAQSSQGSGLALPPFRQMSLAGVLNHRQLSLLGYLQNQVEVGNRPAHVNRDDATSPF